jgi:hypothetical protein
LLIGWRDRQNNRCPAATPPLIAAVHLQTEMKTQARAENLISVAAKLSSMLDECDLDTHAEPELRPLPVESTLSQSHGNH